MSEFSKKIVCVDLETTHLDFKEGRIMEVAAVRGELFFDEKLSKVTVKFEDEFDFLVDPEIEVPLIALQLTGIKTSDLEESSPWKDVKTKFDDFIQDELVVGHNIGFDLGYLENQGSKLKNEFIDTLELSQTLLPVTASHSLEALAENLGVQIGVSHRALEDCKTSALVLVELLNQFLLLPLDVQEKIRPLLASSGSKALSIVEDLPRVTIKGTSVLKQQVLSVSPLKIDFPYENQTIYSTPISFSQQQEWLSYLASQSEKAIIGVANKFYLDSIPQDQVVVSPSRALCSVKFNHFLNNNHLNLPAKKIIVKTIVYLHYNNSLDLGRVSFNPEERALIGRLMVHHSTCLVHRCEYFNHLQFSSSKNRFVELGALFDLINSWQFDFKKNKAVLFELAEIEEGIIRSQSNHLTLQKAREILGAVYPVDESGFSFLDKISKEATAFLNELDLFFGILHLVFLKRKGEYSETLVLNSSERESEKLEKIISPAEKLIKKIEDFIAYIKNKVVMEDGEVALQMTTLQSKLNKFKDFIDELFVNPKQEKIYWLKFNSEWVDLNSAPKDLKNYMSSFLDNVESLSIVDTELAEKSLDYFESRLGVESFQKRELMNGKEEEKAVVKFLEFEFTPEKLSDFISSKNRASIVVVSNVSQLLKFFEVFTQDEMLSSRLVSYKYSGGLGNVRRKLKNLRDESKPFIFLVTTNAVSRYFSELPQAMDLYIQKIPFEAPSAGSPARKKQDTRNDFIDNALPRALYNLNLILTRFVFEQSDNNRQEIYLADKRITTDYDKAFLEYLQNLNGVDFQI